MQEAERRSMLLGDRAYLLTTHRMCSFDVTVVVGYGSPSECGLCYAGYFEADVKMWENGSGG